MLPHRGDRDRFTAYKKLHIDFHQYRSSGNEYKSIFKSNDYKLELFSLPCLPWQYLEENSCNASSTCNVLLNWNNEGKKAVSVFENCLAFSLSTSKDFTIFYNANKSSKMAINFHHIIILYTRAETVRQHEHTFFDNETVSEIETLLTLFKRSVSFSCFLRSVSETDSSIYKI